jgi:hypothetical protein
MISAVAMKRAARFSNQNSKRRLRLGVMREELNPRSITAPPVSGMLA